jgi:hypothetical protein
MWSSLEPSAPALTNRYVRVPRLTSKIALRRQLGQISHSRLRA